MNNKEYRVALMKRTYKFRLYPTTPQQTTLTQWLTTCRMLYNKGLAERKDAWNTHQHSVSYYEQATQLKAAKKTNPYLKAVHSQVLQDTLRRLDKTFKNFFIVKQGLSDAQAWENLKDLIEQGHKGRYKTLIDAECVGHFLKIVKTDVKKCEVLINFLAEDKKLLKLYYFYNYRNNNNIICN